MKMRIREFTLIEINSAAAPEIPGLSRSDTSILSYLGVG